LFSTRIPEIAVFNYRFLVWTIVLRPPAGL
jgi:hypothetical protein